MDQGPLVTEQIDAGAALIREFDKYAPLQAAFWLKDSEDGGWYLYLVSDRIDDSNLRPAHGEVHRILAKGSNIWLDPLFQVKVRGVENAVAKAVMEIQQQYPSMLPTRLRTLRLGDLYVAEVYIYQLPVPAAA